MSDCSGNGFVPVEAEEDNKRNNDLRTRIASALLGDYCVQGMTQPCDDCWTDALRQATWVIHDLGLGMETRCTEMPDGKKLWQRRYATFWEGTTHD